MNKVQALPCGGGGEGRFGLRKISSVDIKKKG
jgi:hypothetical protein